MTRAVGEDTEMITSLDEVAVLFDQAQTSVFKLMASVCLPCNLYQFTANLTHSIGLSPEILQRSEVRQGY